VQLTFFYKKKVYRFNHANGGEKWETKDSYEHKIKSALHKRNISSVRWIKPVGTNQTVFTILSRKISTAVKTWKGSTADSLIFTMHGVQKQRVTFIFCRSIKLRGWSCEMNIEDLLNRLSKVKQTGNGKWKACCPSHDDQSPSLSIRQLVDGRILIHCFGGCGAIEILNSIGLNFSDLHPGENCENFTRIKRPWNSYDVLNGVAFEILVAYNCSKKLAETGHLSKVDQERLLICTQRLQAGLQVLHG